MTGEILINIYYLLNWKRKTEREEEEEERTQHRCEKPTHHHHHHHHLHFLSHFLKNPYRKNSSLLFLSPSFHFSVGGLSSQLELLQFVVDWGIVCVGI
ncbi:hypothetical protein RJT34_25799 [Clitoria ternatea]|uniref:Uncharacterized protein n=1 Tax=Clitoria ternatea TaxID=43366 RepID=A0AAN9IIU6_CLITE